jgi:hypothetical protein
MVLLKFFAKHRPTIKNPKEPPSQRTKTLQTMDNRATTDRTPAPNSTFPKGGVSCSKDSFVVIETFVLLMNFCGETPALREAAKR